MNTAYFSSSSLLLFSLNPPIPAPSEETASSSHPSTPAGSPVLAAFVLLFDPVAVPDVFDPVVPVFVPDVPVVVVVLPDVEDAFTRALMLCSGSLLLRQRLSDLSSQPMLS